MTVVRVARFFESPVIADAFPSAGRVCCKMVMDDFGVEVPDGAECPGVARWGTVVPGDWIGAWGAAGRPVSRIAVLGTVRFFGPPGVLFFEISVMAEFESDDSTNEGDFGGGEFLRLPFR